MSDSHAKPHATPLGSRLAVNLSRAPHPSLIHIDRPRPPKSCFAGSSDWFLFGASYLIGRMEAEDHMERTSAVGASAGASECSKDGHRKQMKVPWYDSISCHCLAAHLPLPVHLLSLPVHLLSLPGRSLAAHLSFTCNSQCHYCYTFTCTACLRSIQCVCAVSSVCAQYPVCLRSIQCVCAVSSVCAQYPVCAAVADI